MIYDVLVIGGGINGAAIAADAAGRGLRVMLCEKNDFGSATSSNSSKLIHGGLRYLAQYHFKLVTIALKERRILLKRAPHLVHPLSFIMPDSPDSLSPLWIRLGLWLYDHLAATPELQPARRIDLTHSGSQYSLKHPKKGFKYSDCWGNDARLVIANLQLAQACSATLYPRMTVLSAEPDAGSWRIRVQPEKGGVETLWAKALVNATGPYADAVMNTIFPDRPPVLRLVKGSHFIIKRFYTGEDAFILPCPDGRIVFLIPFLSDLLIVGTTDVDYAGDPADVKMDEAEIRYLIDIVNTYFDYPITRGDILWDYSGVRPLYDDHHAQASRLSRDYHLVLDTQASLPLLTVYGGKLTTHRHLAEEALAHLAPYFPEMGPSWTETAVFPHGDIGMSMPAFIEEAYTVYPFLPRTLIHRLASDYGKAIHLMLAGVHNVKALGQHFGADLYEKEVHYLLQYEWAQTAEDILWRRTKLGLFLSADEREVLNSWLKA